MISDERISEIIDFAESFGRHPKLDECASMAKELLAYRQAFSEPCGFINPVYFNDGMMGCTLHKKIRRNGLVPLYRKPTIPE